MPRCDRCGKEEGMPYQCRLCGGTFCADHRLPENHDCPGLDAWNDPSGVFDSGFDDSVDDSSSSRASVLGLDTGPGGVLGYFRGNATFVFLGLMWLTFVVQYVVFPVLLGVPVNSRTWLSVFTLNTQNPLAVWTWVISIFSHGGITHIVFNSIVLYFFGPIVERRIGSAKFSALFLVSGVLAGLAQVGATLLQNPGAYGLPLGFPGTAAVLGASGAIAALMGVLTVLNPNLRIYLYFVIPMPLWVATLLFAGYSVLMSTVAGVGGGNVAQFAHLAGLAIGLLYGLKLKREGERAPSELRFGGGGGGGMGGRRRY